MQRPGLWFATAALAAVCLPMTTGVADQVAVEKTVGEAELDPNDPTAELLKLAKPGFSLQLAEDDLQEQIVKFRSFMDEKDWGKAFRLLTELSNTKMTGMVPINDNGLHISVKQQLSTSLLDLPPDGLEAFRLYFDGEAKELFEKISSHPRPGSDEHLELTQQMVDRLLASSMGGEAADLLGDMYFERGRFSEARQNWKLALKHGEMTGRDVFALEAKIVLATQRGGDLKTAAAMYRELKARYGNAKATLGGEEIDAIAMMGKSLGSIAPAGDAADDQAQAEPLWLPKEGAMPAWHQQFMTPLNSHEIKNSVNQNSYSYTPRDLIEHVPQVVADDKRVYFHYLGTLFAHDRATGKIVWKLGKMDEGAQTAIRWKDTSAGDPQNYKIAQTPEVLLVTCVQRTGSSRYSRMMLTAYDKKTGGALWNSEMQQWYVPPAPGQRMGGASIRGEVLVHEGAAYVVYQPLESPDCFLRKFDPESGEVFWNLPLGTAASIMFYQYSNTNRMPQPKMLMYRGDLLLMTNNGAVMSIDTASASLKWAVRTAAPFGLENDDDDGRRGNRLSDEIRELDNPNGSGQMLVRKGVLYVKEHNADTLYAIKPDTGKMLWSTPDIKRDARLIGVDDKHAYLVNRTLLAYPLKGNAQPEWTNDRNTGQTRDAAVIYANNQFLVLGNHGLTLLDAQDKAKTIAEYTNDEYLGNNGGRLYRFDDLLICIDKERITAFKRPEKD